MNLRTLLLPLSVIALLPACGAMPKTPDEYRKALLEHPNMMGVRIENFEVQRPFPESAQFVRKKSNECLKASIKWSERTSTSFSMGITRYDPFATITANQAQVYVTETYLSPSGEQRGDKYFMFVADFKPVKNKTKVDLYYTWGEPRPRTAKAVRAWAAGEDVGCPNLTAR